jgi:hypothetical protein
MIQTCGEQAGRAHSLVSGLGKMAIYMLSGLQTTNETPRIQVKRLPCGIQPLRSLTARKAPVAERDQPMPDSALRRKKGSGTSNHRSRAPNRKTRERERMLTLGLFLRQNRERKS